jgi:conjugal transfer pilin signal peptidase TrbI
VRTRQRAFLMVCAAILFLGVRQATEIASRYRFGVNETTSLPDWAFVVDRANRQPSRGQLVQFIAPDNPYYPKASPFVKRVWGVAGDRVERRGREYYVAGRDVGAAKPFSQTGRATNLGPTGIIPPGRYYVGAPNPDSLDSRYAEIGWIGADRIVGVAEPVL